MTKKRKRKKGKHHIQQPDTRSVAELKINELWAELSTPQNRPKPAGFNARKKHQQAKENEHLVIQCIVEADPWEPTRIVLRLTKAICEYCNRTHKMLPSIGPMLEFKHRTNGAIKHLAINNPNQGGLSKYPRELHISEITIPCCPSCFKEMLHGQDHPRYVRKRFTLSESSDAEDDPERIRPVHPDSRPPVSDNELRRFAESVGVSQDVSKLSDFFDAERTE